MHSLTSLSFLLLTLFANILTHAAITTPINRNGDYIERNERGTWCYYPQAITDPTSIDVACLGPQKGDYATVIRAQLNQTSAINYFSASLQRLGGPNWVYNGTHRKVYLCMSGRAGDYSYQTMCTVVGRDNSMGNGTFCKLERGQGRVTDGCYVPNQPVPSFAVESSSRQPVVTVTRSASASSSSRTSVPSNSSNASARLKIPGLDFVLATVSGAFSLAFFASLL